LAANSPEHQQSNGAAGKQQQRQQQQGKQQQQTSWGPSGLVGWWKMLLIWEFMLVQSRRFQFNQSGRPGESYRWKKGRKMWARVAVVFCSLPLCTGQMGGLRAHLSDGAPPRDTHSRLGGELAAS